MDAWITNGGFIVPLKTIKAVLGDKYTAFIKKHTITTIQKRGKLMDTKICKMYKFEKVNGVLCLFLPRKTGELLTTQRLLRSKLMRSEVVRINAPMTGELFPNQITICNYLMQEIFSTEKLARGFAGCTLDLRPGMGKTFTAGGMISFLGLRTLYIAPRVPVAIQASGDLKGLFGNNRNGVIVGRYEKKPKKNFITKAG